jgi:hypothetical protein
LPEAGDGDIWPKNEVMGCPHYHLLLRHLRHDCFHIDSILQSSLRFRQYRSEKKMYSGNIYLQLVLMYFVTKSRHNALGKSGPLPTFCGGKWCNKNGLFTQKSTLHTCMMYSVKMYIIKKSQEKKQM